MAQVIENVRGVAGHEPGGADFASQDVLEAPTHALDTDEMRRLHGRLLDWYYTAVDAFFDNRIDQMLDYDFYDHIQWSEADEAVLRARHQAPLVYNKIKMALDWIIGTERRTRIDGVVHPRSEDDVELAGVKSELLKYVSDVNRVPWERSLAFKDQVIVGLGWTEESIRTNDQGEPVAVWHVPWRQMRRDPVSRALDLADCRFLTREKIVDLDYGEAMFPERLDLVRRAARDYINGDDFGYEESTDIPQLFRKYDSRGYEIQSRRIAGRSSIENRTRLRVRLIEVWFRKPVAIKRLWGADFRGVRYDRTNEDHRAAFEAVQRAREGGAKTQYSLSDAVQEEMWRAVLTEDGLLSLERSPFNHGRFPYTPYWGYRRNRDGMEYGIVRGVRDAQEDLNKRMSKLLWQLSSNQFFYEDGAIDPDELENIRTELAKPNGIIKLANGGLARIKVERNTDVADAQIELLNLDAAHIHDGSGVNRELLGRDTNAQSGRAIMAKQNEGAVTTAELFDNFRLGIQLSGEKQLSLMEQFMTEERQFRIVGEKKGVDWRTINQLRLDTLNNVWVVDNDVSRSQADFIVDQQDFRESMRQAFAEQFMEMLKAMPPDIAIQLMDLAFDMVDMPMKDEVVQRIRKITGQSDQEADPNDPQVQARQQQQQQDAEIALRERLAKVGLDEAKAAEVAARATKLQVETKGKALDVASLLEALLPLAPAADRLMSTSNDQSTENPSYATA